MHSANPALPIQRRFLILLLRSKALPSTLQAKAEDKEENERMFKLVNEGNGVLSDANKRRKYDAGYSLEEIEVRLPSYSAKMC